MEEKKKNDTVVEESFSDAELGDIMAEIDDLEKEVMKDAHSSATTSAASTDTDDHVEREEDAELAAEPEESLEEAESDDSPAIEFDAGELEELEALDDEEGPSGQSEAKVIPMKSPHLAEGVEFSLSLPIGENKVVVSYCPSNGLKVDMGALEMTLHPEKGHRVLMDNGVEFSIPVNKCSSKAKKVG